MNVIRAPLNRSCHHCLMESVALQTLRLQNAVFPKETVTSVAEKLLNEVRARKRQNCEVHAFLVAMPHVQNLSHRLKNMAKKCGVKLVQTAQKKLGCLCPLVNGAARQPSCATNHETRLVPCKACVLHKLPLTCGKSYVGQSGRCLNERLREHRLTVKSLLAGGNHAVHCKRCPSKTCKPIFQDARVLATMRTQSER